MYQKMKTTIEVEVTVWFEFNPEERGCRDSMGVPEEPDIPAHVDIEVVEYPKELPADTITALKEECLEELIAEEEY